ncbi:hypothetical protein YQE_00546, partial [Dendroctonus ponderosae]
MPGELTFIAWVQEEEQNQSPEAKNIGLEKETDQPRFVDSSQDYISDPPTISQTPGSMSFEPATSLLTFLQTQSDFDVLIMGTNDGILTIHIFGLYKCTTINISERVDKFHNIKTIVLNTSIMRDYLEEFYYLSVKFVKLQELMCYLDRAIANMTETWESILLDIDTKLSNYARKRPAEGVTVDFLELLVWGECAPTLQEFLLVDLTKKGLETFGHAVDMSYSTIRTVLIDHVLTFSQNGVYHLSEMKGMAAFKDRYGVIAFLLGL